jgi:hypothetical protein
MHIDALSSSHGKQPPAEPAGTPPPEAIFATHIAGAVARQLSEAGLEVRFSLAPQPQRVNALLCDTDGHVLSELSASRVLDIASGDQVPGGRR